MNDCRSFTSTGAVFLFCGGLLCAPTSVYGQSTTTDTDTEQASASTPALESEAEPNSTPKQAEESMTQVLSVKENLLRLTIPAEWKIVKPRNNIIEMELAIFPKPTDSEKPNAEDETSTEIEQQAAPRGRLTMMAAGGDIDSNIRRWVGQFRLGRDADGKDAMRREERKLRGAMAHILDIAGTYFDSPRGPFGPKVELPNYRMLGAIIEVEGHGKYFVKFYGPAELVAENHEAFDQMLASIEVVKPSEAEDSPEHSEDGEES